MPAHPFDLSGRTALVTGGNGGIGLGMAEALAKAGASLAIWGTNAAKNAAAVEKLRSLGARAEAWTVNVAEEAAVVAGFADALASFGRIDTVIANAGVGGEGGRPFIEHTAEGYRRIMSVNLDGVFFTLREACRHMVQRAKDGDPGGSLVAVASIAAIEGAARNEGYGASKGGVVAMTRAIAVEHARFGVRANAILPGWIATDMTQGAQANPKFTENVISRVPARRWGEPEDFGGIAVYLASDASRFHTGDCLVVDGGYSIY